MTVRTILVPIEVDADNDSRVRWAAGLAGLLKARLFGIAAAEVRVNVHRGMSPVAATELLRQETQATESRLAAMGEAFLAAAGEGATWRGLIGDLETLLPLHARAADLVVAFPTGGAAADPATLILTAGRPVLVAAAQLPPLAADVVLVAWKDTREARRAVADALPILQVAREVRVVSVLEANAGAAREGANDVAAFLRQHDVNARAEVIEPHGSIGEALAVAAREAGADLIVTGGYSRGPLRQRVFGGMTRSLLEEQSVHRLFSN